jgi:hypothetical protein
MRRFTVSIAVLLLHPIAAGCAADDACQDAVAHVESCGFRYLADPCETAEDRCRTECDGELSCDELAGVESGSSNRKRSLCISACYDPFACADGSGEIPRVWVCDMEEDCRDGSDERKCD